MAAVLSIPFVDAAPGNTIQIAGSGLTPGGGASVTLNHQGVSAAPGLIPATITLPAVFNTTNVQIGPIPDGVMDGTLTVTASDATVATCSLRARSQYLQAFEYLSEGEDVSNLAAMTAAGCSELDIILRRASEAVDIFMGAGVRQLQVSERPKYNARREGPPLLYPYRIRGRDVPILSVEQLVFISAKDLVTVFNPNDFYVNDSLGYIEILAYAIGNYALLGELEVIGYSANVLELSYTSGFPMAKYPAAVREATLQTATYLLNRRRRQAMGLGPFANFRDEAKIDQVALTIPREAKLMLLPYVIRTLS